jgi:CHAT domain-containing protein/Tfp pilus assembly protein PilF
MTGQAIKWPKLKETSMRALLCGLLLAGLACGAAPPARLTPEQVKLLRERNVLWDAVVKAWKAGKQAEAITALEKVLRIERDTVGPWHRGTEKTADVLAFCYQARGGWGQEAKYRRMVIEARRMLDGAGHYRTVDARLQLAEALAQAKRTPAQRAALARAFVLHGQAESLYRKGQDAKAAPLYRQALSIRKEVLGEKHRDYATSLNGLALLYHSMGDHKQALPLFQQALAICKEVLGQKHPSYANILHNLASLCVDMGDHKTALPLFQQALAIHKEALGEKHPDCATSLNDLASLYVDMGDHKAALPLFQQALSIRNEVLGQNHPRYALSLNNLAALYRSMGEYKAALPLFQKALAIRKEVQGERHPDYAMSLNNLAALYYSMGEYKAAVPLCKQALAIKKEVLGQKHPLYAASLNNLASLYKSMGEYRAALPLMKQALAITKKALGEKHPDYARSLNNLALLYDDMGDHKAALSLCKQALAISKEALGEKHPEYAASLHNLAALYRAMGDHKQALPPCKQALEIRKEVLGEKHPRYATSLNNLALLYRSMGDYKAALPRFEQALSIRKEVLGERHPLYANSLNTLALLYQDMGDHKQALPLAEEAINLTTSYLRASASVQSDRQQFAATEALRHRLDLRLSLGNVDCYRHALAWKGAVLLRQRQRRLFSALDTNPKTRQAASELQAVTRQIAALSASPRPAREQLERLTKEQERLQAKLALLSAEARAAFKAEALTPRALSAALPEGVVLVDYHFYRRYGVASREGSPNPVLHLVAFVSRKGRPTVRVDLGPAQKAEDAVGQWYPTLARGLSGKSAGAVMKKLVWSPLEKLLEGAKVVLISPDEALAAVPFAALPGKKPNSYLIEDVALAVVPVPQMLPLMLKPVDKSKRLKPSLLVVGNVDYDRAGTITRADKAGDRGAPLGIRRAWGWLPGTFAEAVAVSKSFTGLFEGGTITDLGRGNATKARVREALGKVRYAHLATHGFFAPEEIKSALGGKKADGLFGREGVTGWHPLLLSGIVLSGANKEPKAGQEDGILTALEVSEMQLPKLELVVLSACKTGLGKSAGGEGLLGLQRAFAVAGARTVVASLWSVDDRATQVLMSEFYRVAWDPDSIVSRAEALRRAQLYVLKVGKRRGIGKEAEKLPKGAKEETRLPPLYWAAFVLSGDWR